jgi:hypothetical protein
MTRRRVSTEAAAKCMLKCCKGIITAFKEPPFDTSTKVLNYIEFAILEAPDVAGLLDYFLH